jgi:phage terminase large subunit
MASWPREIVNRIATWREHPAQMVREAFQAEPDPFQEEALEIFPRQQRIAMQASKGPGKTTTLAWLAWNFLLTRPHPKCAATSISGQNLHDNFWTEMAKWQNRNPFLKERFTWTKTRIFANDHPETWFLSARTWPQSADKDKQADTLAGLHADYILFLLDESGGIPDAVMASAEAALSSCIEGHIVQAGNPTMRSGPLFRAAYAERKLWYVIEINADPNNPKRSNRVSIQWAREQIEKYGADNPWVLVNVFGRFPPSSLNVLIGDDEVKAAMERYYRAHEIGQAAKVLGVDVARFGDDASCMIPRQGIQCLPIEKQRNIDSTQGAGWVSRKWDHWGADVAFIDMTGGYGTGWFDQLIKMGKAPIGVMFSAKAHNSSRYYNKRTEMYFDAVDWIRRGGALPLPQGMMPERSELLQALTQTTYTFQGDRLLLESKDQIKERLGFSPDEADSFVETFAEPVTPMGVRPPRPIVPAVYKPFADIDRQVEAAYGGQGEYNPYRER